MTKRPASNGAGNFKWFHTTEYGKVFNGDSYHFISNLGASSVELIITSPPFGLVREKKPTSGVIALKTPFAGSKTSAASPPEMTSSQEITLPPCASSLLSYGGFYESGP